MSFSNQFHWCQAGRLIKTGVLPSEFNKERNNGVDSVCKGAIINDNVLQTLDEERCEGVRGEVL